MDDNSNLPALAGPKQQHSLPSDPRRTELQRKFDEAHAALNPAEPKLLVAELASCLTLVAPSGMSADDRTEWLKVARMTVGDIPADPFRWACKEARKTCKFASEIVPAIVKAAAERTHWLRLSARYASEDLERINQVALPEPEYVKPEELAALRASLERAVRKQAN